MGRKPSRQSGQEDGVLILESDFHKFVGGWGVLVYGGFIGRERAGGTLNLNEGEMK